MLEHLVLLTSSSDLSEFSDSMGRFKHFFSNFGVTFGVFLSISGSESELCEGKYLSLSVPRL